MCIWMSQADSAAEGLVHARATAGASSTRYQRPSHHRHERRREGHVGYDGSPSGGG